MNGLWKKELQRGREREEKRERQRRTLDIEREGKKNDRDWLSKRKQDVERAKERPHTDCERMNEKQAGRKIY